MNPAFSVVALTTLIGAGQGLFLAATLAALTGTPDAVTPRFQIASSAVAVGLMLTGLLASFFHLGHPERAWRTAAMWRTSWLSREVILLPINMALIAAYGLAHYQGYTTQDGLVLSLAALTVLVTVALFVATAMIYSSLAFLQEWATPLTTVNFTVLGCASGFCLATVLASATAPQLETDLAWLAGALTLFGFVTRGASLIRNHRLRPKSTLQSAIGVRHPKIVQTSPGFMGSSFNTREFFHKASARNLAHIRWLFLMAVFALPIALLVVGVQSESTLALVLAWCCQYVGLLAERWYFFAEANHPQNLYYQTIG